MTIDLARLEALARAATPEEWDDSVSVDDEVARAHDFRAAANPAAVLELVERLRAAEAIVRDLAEADPDNIMGPCKFCGAGYRQEHLPTCEHRRAREATK